MRRAAKVDANQQEIIDTLRMVPGVTVFSLHRVGQGCPDLLVGRGGINYLLEIKNPEYSGKLTHAERDFHDFWRGQVAIVTSPDEALQVIGVIHESF